MNFPLTLTSTLISGEIAVKDNDSIVLFRMIYGAITRNSYSDIAYHIGINPLEFGVMHKAGVIKTTGKEFFEVQRNNLVSLYSTYHTIVKDNEIIMVIKDGKSLGKTFGGLFDGTPLEEVGRRLWDPAYIISTSSNKEIFRIDKERSFGTRNLTIWKVGECGSEYLEIALVGFMTSLLLEDNYRNRLFW